MKQTSTQSVADAMEVLIDRRLDDQSTQRAKAAATPEGQRLLARIHQLADEGLRSDCGREEYAAYAVARAVHPARPETVLEGHTAMLDMINGNADQYGATLDEPEDLDMMLALSRLLSVLRIVPGLRFEPHSLQVDGSVVKG